MTRPTIGALARHYADTAPESDVGRLARWLLAVTGEDWDDDTIGDGYGNEWPICCPACGLNTMEVARPGKVQCGACDGTGEMIG